ncbi:FAD-binding protein [Tsukamurella pulmonis]|uniref:FAD-binding oxidoreductase n=1 Tax=Tsukamurella pulmonis TaxID=47312 RepID=UPI000798B21D|nr:FAD-binding oxidoreductase [Tsukamurella pulmonis]KXP12919.1 FAD-binding protein [Tsukamurella pulmonis]RDH12934.1 FAD-binding oxidoreductase [Tsukamurella pulmonis]
MEITTADILALDERMSGTVHSGTGAPENRAGAQLQEPHRPAVVVEAGTVDDVSQAVAFVADRGMRVAVQATGHGRTRALDGGLLIDTRRMRDVTVDPAARTAWVSAGATWQDVIERAAPYDLAPLSGSLPTVGAVSYTLGGGIGLLARRYGYAADRVTRFEAVTADGRTRRVSVDDEPDLFWALRGGGGNTAVVTGMEIDLVPVAEVFGGSVMFDLAESPEVLAAWIDWTRSVPEAMTSAVVVIPFPDIGAVPADVRGRQVVQLQVSFAGPEAEGRRIVEPLLRKGLALRNTLRTVPYRQSGAVFDEPDRPMAYRGQSVLVDDLDSRALAALVVRAGTTPGGCTVGVRHLGGALAESPTIPNAVGHRPAQYSVGVLSLLHDSDPNAVFRAQHELLAPFASHLLGPSLNFTFGPLDPEHVGAAFAPADAERLVEIAARYDPQGLLYTNHPIR